MKNKKTRPVLSGAAGVIAIVVVGIFMLCVIFLIAKGLFSSNSSEVPNGLNTATLNTNTDVTAAPAQTEATGTTPASDSDGSQDASSGADDQPQGDLMYVLEYAYLHVTPDNESENIICLSPGCQVTAQGQEDNGYVKVTFQNIDGPLTGYVYKDYLTTEYVQPAWE